MSAPIDPKDLRVSDAERAHVLHILEKATGLGLIDLGEFNERSSVVIGSRTRGELNAVLVDLPGLQVAGRSVDEAVAVTAPADHDPGDVLNLTGWGSRSLKGHWQVPGRIVISGAGASTHLDFTEAQLTTRQVVVEFRGNGGGSAELVVPLGTRVRIDRLEVRGGHLVNKAAPAEAGSGFELELVGRQRYGSVTVRNPKQSRFRRA
jgi:hypothetical protein